MIKVKIGKDKDGVLKHFVVSGHAGYDRQGRDIVCAAVSTVSYTTVGALMDLVGISDFYTERNGYMFCKLDVELSPEKRHTADIIMKTAEIGFKQIELSYPRFVKVMDEEV